MLKHELKITKNNNPASWKRDRITQENQQECLHSFFFSVFCSVCFSDFVPVRRLMLAMATNAANASSNVMMNTLFITGDLITISYKISVKSETDFWRTETKGCGAGIVI